GGTIRQIAHAEYEPVQGTLTAWVAPVAVPHGSIFARTVGANNAVVISGRYAGDVAIAGAGAGGDATAVAVIGDIVAIARDRAAIIPAPVLSRPSRITGFGTTCSAALSGPRSAGLKSPRYSFETNRLSFHAEAV